MQPLIRPTLYKSEKNKDVALQIKSIVYNKTSGKYMLHGVWWNIGECHDPWCMGLEEMIEIPLEKWQREWSIYKLKAGNS